LRTASQEGRLIGKKERQGSHYSKGDNEGRQKKVGLRLATLGGGRTFYSKSSCRYVMEARAGSRSIKIKLELSEEKARFWVS